MIADTCQAMDTWAQAAGWAAVAWAAAFGFWAYMKYRE